jgi:hypothetical protein
MAWHEPLMFDDAYMFYRYAVHMHAGLGMSWNIGGGHTFGETSLLWGLFIWLVTFLPVSAGHILALSSALWSGLAVLAIGLSVAWNSRSQYFKKLVYVIPCITLPLELSSIFVSNLSTGMDTMMALALVSLFAGLVLRWATHHTHWSWMTAAGFAAILTRPECGLVVVIMPLMATLLLTHDKRKWKVFLAFLSTLTALLVVSLFGFKGYFGTALPLSFYIKAIHGYKGAFMASSQPVRSLIDYLVSSWMFIALLALMVRRKFVPVLLVSILPLVVTLTYLLTVLQVMGGAARYDVPYYGLLIVPAMLAFDDWLVEFETDRAGAFRELPARRVLLTVALVAFTAILLNIFSLRINYLLLRPSPVYVAPRLTYAAPHPLPDMGRIRAITRIANDFVKHLPPGTSIAATEVGYPGAVAPQVKLIDLSGLNDPDIAEHGFSPERLLQRKPDVIWLPYSHYTFELGALLADPNLISNYTVYAGAFSFGLAIRKNGPDQSAIEADFNRAWADNYPGYDPTQYIVESVAWSRRKVALNLP